MHSAIYALHVDATRFGRFAGGIVKPVIFVVIKLVFNFIEQFSLFYPTHPFCKQMQQNDLPYL